MKKTLLAALIGTALMASFSAYAQGGYVGLNAGQANTEAGLDEFTAVSKDEKNNAFKLYGGYNFTKNWGIEVGYADFGKLSNVYRVGATNIGFTARSRALYVAGTGTLPVTEQFSLFAKVGVTANNSSVSASAPGITVTDRGTQSSVMGGIGASYYFTKNIGVVAEYENFGKLDSDNAKADMWSIGLRYKF
jgi:OOP family OmpA-OmpF porin